SLSHSVKVTLSLVCVSASCCRDCNPSTHLFAVPLRSASRLPCTRHLCCANTLDGAQGPALSVANGNCRADYRGALVGPAVLWPDEMRTRFLARLGRPMTRPAINSPRRKGTIRCAIYTRKSSEEGLEQEFNSLQAQREACEAFITSQRHEGWVCLRAAYDDGGFSGATINRPALQQLLADLAAGRVDIVVVYKIDRLT